MRSRLIHFPSSIPPLPTPLGWNGFRQCDVKRAHEADLLRMFLLAKFGGVRLDASIFTWKPLEDALVHAVRWGYYFHDFGGAPDRQISDLVYDGETQE